MKYWQEHEAIYKLYTEGRYKRENVHPLVGAVSDSLKSIDISEIGGEGYDEGTKIKLPTQTYMVRELLITTLYMLDIISDDEFADFKLRIKPGYASGQAGIEIPKILAQKDREISERGDEIKEKLERETILYLRRKVTNDTNFYAKVAREVTNKINKDSERLKTKNIQNAVSGSLDDLGLQPATSDTLGKVAVNSFQDIELAVLDSYIATQDLTLFSIQTDNAAIESKLYDQLGRLGIDRETIGRDEKGKYVTYDFFVPVDSKLAQNVAGEEYENLNDPEEYEEYMKNIDGIFQRALNYDNIIVTILPPTDIKQAINLLRSEMEKAARISGRAQQRAKEPKEDKEPGTGEDLDDLEYGESDLPPVPDEVKEDEMGGEERGYGYGDGGYGYGDGGYGYGDGGDGDGEDGDGRYNKLSSERLGYRDEENEGARMDARMDPREGKYDRPEDYDEEALDTDEERADDQEDYSDEADIDDSGPPLSKYEMARKRARDEAMKEREEKKKKTGENNEDIKMSPQQMNQWMYNQRALRMQNNLRQNERWGNY